MSTPLYTPPPPSLLFFKCEAHTHPGGEVEQGVVEVEDEESLPFSRGVHEVQLFPDRRIDTTGGSTGRSTGRSTGGSTGGSTDGETVGQTDRNNSSLGQNEEGHRGTNMERVVVGVEGVAPTPGGRGGEGPLPRWMKSLGTGSIHV